MRVVLIHKNNMYIQNEEEKHKVEIKVTRNKKKF